MNTFDKMFLMFALNDFNYLSLHWVHEYSQELACSFVEFN